MPIIITVHQKGAHASSIELLIEKHIKTKYPDAQISIQRKESATSRSDRFSEAQDFVTDAISIGEELKDELQQWKDNLPENLQNGEKAQQLESAIEEIETFVNNLEEAGSASPEFPTMM